MAGTISLEKETDEGLPDWSSDPFVQSVVSFLRPYAADIGEVAIGFIPVVGDVYDAVTGIVGYSLIKGEPLDPLDRILSLAGFIPIPGVTGKVLRVSKDTIQWILQKAGIKPIDILKEYIPKAIARIRQLWNSVVDILQRRFGRKIKFPRTPQELDDLARDPAHGRKITPKGLHEKKIGLSLESRGQLPGPIQRDPTGAAEFMDANGGKWDIKSFHSNFPPRKGGFDLNRDLGKIQVELNKGENVILDTTNLNAIHTRQLRKAVEANGWSDRIRWWP